MCRHPPCQSGRGDRLESASQPLLKHVPRITLLLPSSLLSTNTLTPPTCSLPLLNLPPGFLLITPLLMVGSPTTRLLSWRRYHLSSNYSLLSRFRNQKGKEGEYNNFFIDGLDECVGEDAQGEIIEIIASCVKARSTSFRWVTFSRTEPRMSHSSRTVSPLSLIALNCRFLAR